MVIAFLSPWAMAHLLNASEALENADALPANTLLRVSLLRGFPCSQNEDTRTITLKLAFCIETALKSRTSIGSSASRASRAAFDLLRDPGLSVAELAQRQCVTMRQLERDFTRSFHVTPKRYAGTVRIQRALRAMANGASLTEAALKAGYFDHSQMNRGISAAFGIPPKKIQKLVMSEACRALQAALGGRVVAI